MLHAGLRAADPFELAVRALRRHRRGLDPVGRLVVLAVGKAAPRMAQAAESVLRERIDASLAVASAGGPRLRRTRLLLSGHPLPDARGLRAAREALALADALGPKDLLLVLLSGGASALLPCPVPGVSLADKAALTGLLLRRGATIHELNAVRKHLSRVKGGGLLRAAAPARVLTLALSDVVGDAPSTIGSGPSVPDPTTFAQAIAALRLRRCWKDAPAPVRAHLLRGARGESPETLKPGDAGARRSRFEIVGSNRLSLAAAAREARRAGFRALPITDRLEGEARDAGRALVAKLRACVETGRPARPPVCLLASGETTVTVTGQGRGGRNQELVLACVDPLAAFPEPGVVASFASDGVDGNSEAAGSVADDASLARARERGLAEPAAFLSENDSNGFFAGLGDLIVTGPTGTNVLDLSVLLA